MARSVNAVRVGQPRPIQLSAEAIYRVESGPVLVRERKRTRWSATVPDFDHSSFERGIPVYAYRQPDVARARGWSARGPRPVRVSATRRWCRSSPAPLCGRPNRRVVTTGAIARGVPVFASVTNNRAPDIGGPSRVPNEVRPPERWRRGEYGTLRYRQGIQSTTVPSLSLPNVSALARENGRISESPAAGRGVGVPPATERVRGTR
jgi:hypothetical protein